MSNDDPVVNTPDWEENRKDKQYPLPPLEEADTASFGEPQ